MTRSFCSLALMASLLGAPILHAQSGPFDSRRSLRASGQQQPPPPPPANTVAPDIPGVVKGGTTVHVIKSGFQGTEGPIGMPDGTLDLHRDAGQPHHAHRGRRHDVDVPREHERIERPRVRCEGPTDLGADHAGSDEDRRDLSEGRRSGAHRQLRRQGVRPAERSRRQHARAASTSPSRDPTRTPPARRRRRRRRCRRRCTTSRRAGRR